MSDNVAHQTLCIRADADSIMGVGHVMRCLALAQAWQDAGGKVCLITAMRLPGLLERMNEERVEVVPITTEVATKEDADFTHRVAVTHGAMWLVLDGYHFSAAYHGWAKQNDLKLLVLDDLASQNLSEADIILNQNAYASEGLYEQSHVGGELLLASPYALIRREFFSQKKAGGGVGDCRRVIVTLGGADTRNVTCLVLQALEMAACEKLELMVVAGAANQHLDSLRTAIEKVSGRYQVTLLVNPPNMPELMARADLAITAAGSSCWEFAFLGVPMLVLLTAENQVLVVDYLRRAGLASVFGLLTPAEVPAFASIITEVVQSRERRSAHALSAAALIDGGGAARVVKKLIDTAKIKV